MFAGMWIPSSNSGDAWTSATPRISGVKPTEYRSRTHDCTPDRRCGVSERAAYSRVYWSIIDDPKFANVYDDDRALAAWLRLLLVADQAWPASAHLPTTVRRQAVAVLVGSGLVDLQAGGRYRIHGLDAERTRRKDAATRQPTGRDPSGSQQGPNRDPDGPDTTGLSRERDETRKDETSQAETVGREALDGPLAYYELTGKYPPHNSPLSAWTTRLAEEYGAEAFQSALASEYTVNRNLADLLSRTESRLAKNADAVRAEYTARKAAEREQAQRDRLLSARAEEDARRERIASQAPKPLAELMPDVAKHLGRSA